MSIYVFFGVEKVIVSITVLVMYMTILERN